MSEKKSSESESEEPTTPPSDPAAPGNGENSTSATAKAKEEDKADWLLSQKAAKECTRRILRTVLIGFIAAGFLVLISTPLNEAWAATLMHGAQMVLGFTLVYAALHSYTGFYIATKKARVGIISAFATTFFVLLAYVIAMPAIGVQLGDDVGKELMKLITIVVSAAVAFYFGTDAAITGISAWKGALLTTDDQREEDTGEEAAVEKKEPDAAVDLAVRNIIDTTSESLDEVRVDLERNVDATAIDPDTVKIVLTRVGEALVEDEVDVQRILEKSVQPARAKPRPDRRAIMRELRRFDQDY